MYITWHGHACFEIGNKKKLLFDPHDGKSIGIKPPIATPDIVLISHQHFDHNATRILHGKFKVYDSPGYFDEGDIKIFGYRAYHDEVGGKKRGEVTLYKVVVEDITFLHTGDLGHVLPDKTIQEIGSVDILFVPVGGVFTLDAQGAYRVVNKINPKVVIPMHYRIGGLTLSIRGVDEFLALFPKDSIEHVGKTMEFEKEDLCDKLCVWVFSID